MMPKPRGLARFWPADIGPGTPPREPPGGAPGTQGRQKVAIYSPKTKVYNPPKWPKQEAIYF